MYPEKRPLITSIILFINLFICFGFIGIAFDNNEARYFPSRQKKYKIKIEKAKESKKLPVPPIKDLLKVNNLEL